MTIRQNQAISNIKSDNAQCAKIEEQDALEHISPLTNEDTKFSENKKSELSIAPYPWRRYFARKLDLVLYASIGFCFAKLFLNTDIETNFSICLINTYIVCGVMLFLETFLLSVCGTTLGKWVFGISLRNADNQKITYDQAWRRTLGVFGQGMGYNIPIYSLVCHFKCYDDCKANIQLPWEENLVYVIKDRIIVRIIAFIIAVVLICSIPVFVSMEAKMPLHTGNITPEQYYENCNAAMVQANLDYGSYLDGQGEWIGEPKESDDLYLSTLPLPKHELTVTDGIVTGVRIEVETNNELFIEGYRDQKYIAIISFLAAQPEMNGVCLQLSGVLKEIDNEYENYTFTEAGIKVTNKIELRGYEPIEKGFSQFGLDFLPIEGEEQHFHMVFTMEKVE